MSIDDDVQKEAHCPACAASESTTRLKDRGVVRTLMKAVAMMRAELVAHGMSEDAAGKLKGPALKDQVRALMNDGAMYLTAAVNGSGPMDQDDANGPAAELEGEESTPTATSDTEGEARQKRNCLLDSPGKGITPINVDKRQTRLMRGRRLTLSLEGKQKEEEGAPFGCFERPHFDKQQTKEVWNQALQLLSASPSPCQGYDAYVRIVRSHGGSRAPVLSREMFRRLTIIHLHVTTAILEEYLVLSRSTTIEVQQRLRERRPRIMWPLYADYLNRYVLQSDGFWPEKNQSPNGAVGTQSSLTFLLVAFCQLTKFDMIGLAPSLLTRYPHRFVDDLGEDNVASGDMDPRGQVECFLAILGSEHQLLVLGCVWTVDGDVTEDSKSVFSIIPFGKEENRPRRVGCLGHKGKRTRQHTTGPMSSVKKQVCFIVNPETGLANCKFRKDQHRWHDELGYSVYHFEIKTFKLGELILLPELKVPWYDAGAKMPLDIGSGSGMRALLKSRALAYVKRRLSGERIVAHAMGNCDGCDHGELDQTDRRLFSCDGQGAYIKDLMDKTVAKVDEYLSDFGCLNINIEESFHAQAALFCQKGNNLDWPLVFTFQNMAALTGSSFTLRSGSVLSGTNRGGTSTRTWLLLSLSLG